MRVTPSRARIAAKVAAVMAGLPGGVGARMKTASGQL
jgi:hypothetical protein